jgi:hypothetical protein
MIEVLQFIFSSFWVFCGVLTLLIVVCDCLGGAIQALGRRE